jgi:hypothetical protein
MKRVYATGSLQEAELLRVLLRQNGIESLLENEFSSNVALGAASVPLIVTVSDADEPGAIHVIRKYLAKREKPK